MKTPAYATQREAIAEINALALGTITPQQRETRRVTEQEHYSIRFLLAELHRLHVAIARETAKTRKLEKNEATNRRRTRDLKRPRPTTPAKKKVTPQ
jgi:hypothetical protein